jgi:hypothetical protein
MSVRLVCLACMLPVLLSGCSLMPASVRRAMAAPYKPANVSVKQATMPASIRRVAVLPLPRVRGDDNQTAGASLLEPVFLAELQKRKVFEVIPISAETARELSRGDSWSADAALPPDFFDRLHKLTACDAVVFVSLTAFRPYPPLQTGWKARLVDCQNRDTWWAVDEVFDAGSESVVAAAETYARTELAQPNPLLTDTGVLHSPLRFGQYTANAVAHTLPSR